jgi:hypothetical protein
MHNHLITLFLLSASTLITSQAVDLGLAQQFGVLSGSAGATSTGSTYITGSLGTTGVSIVGFPPGVITGTEHIDDSVAIAAQTDANNAYAQAKALPPDYDYSVKNDLTGMTLYPGTYFFSGAVSLTGALYLSGNGTNDSFVFQIGTSLLINAGSEITLEDGASACDVFWQVGSSATLAVGISFTGNILAYAGVAVQTGASVEGGLYANTASVTLDSNAITVPACG